MTRNGGNRWVYPIVPTESRYTKLEGYFAKMGNRDIEFLAVRADFEVSADVANSTTPKRDRRHSRINNAEHAVTSLR